MVLGVGIDAFDVRRMRRALREDAGLTAAVFAPGEIAECEAAPDPARAYAARFAAKEAVLKGLGLQPPDPGMLREIEVVTGSGAPTVAVHGRLAARLAGTEIRPRLSLAHTSDHAIATVIVEHAARDA
jgi:holo-[acyl-carrier protein] synthase